MLRPPWLLATLCFAAACGTTATTDKVDTDTAVETDDSDVETDITAVDTDVDTDATVVDTDTTDVDTDTTDVDTDTTDVDTDTTDVDTDPTDTDLPGDPDLFLHVNFDGGTTTDLSPNAWTDIATGTAFFGVGVDGAANGSLTGTSCRKYGNTAFNSANNQISVAFWVKPWTASVNSIDVVEANYGTFLVRSFAGNRWILEVFDTTGASATFWQPEATEVADTWAHIAFSIDVDAGTMKSWRNGVAVTTTGVMPAGDLKTMANNSVEVTCGLNAHVDDVRVYSRTLSDAEVLGFATP